MEILLQLFSFWTSFVFLFNDIPDTVPTGVECTKVSKCDSKGKICALICEPGSVKMSSNVAAVLKLQRKLSYSQPFCEAQLPGTHNSAINLADVSFIYIPT